MRNKYIAVFLLVALLGALLTCAMAEDAVDLQEMPDVAEQEWAGEVELDLSVAQVDDGGIEIAGVIPEGGAIGEDLPVAQIDDAETEIVEAVPGEDVVDETASPDAPQGNAATAIPKALTLGVGEQTTLKVSGKPKFKSSKKTVATVTSKGVITAKKKGSAVITVTSGKKKLGSCKVTVVPKPKSVSLPGQKTATLEVTQTLQLKPKLPKGTHASFTYSSSKKKVASVSTTGLITAKAAGEATITVKTHNGAQAKCKVTVTEPNEENIRLVYAEVNPIEGTVHGEMAKAFKEKVEALSNGTITVELYGSGVMGSEYTVLSNILAGDTSVDLVRCSASALIPFGCTKASLLSLPYVFESEAHFWKFATSDLAKEFLNEPQQIGLPMRGVCYGEEGFRHFMFREEVKGIGDLKGKKIRVSDDPIMTGMVKDLGASAIAIAYPELYTALQVGVADGMEHPVLNYLANSFNEVAPYLVMDGHTVGAMQIVITDSAWAKMSAKQQNAVMKAGTYASQACKKKVAAMEKEALTTLKKNGVTVVKVADKAPWRKACKSTINANITNKSLYNKILALAG